MQNAMMLKERAGLYKTPKKTSTFIKFAKRFRKEKFFHLLVLPGILYFFIFHYIPMYGVIMAFKSYSPAKGIWGSPWVGFLYFEQFFNSIYFFRLIRNTFLLSFYSLIFGFPVPIIFAILVNEVKNKYFQRTVQTISYFPHFISVVIVVGIMVSFLSPVDGIVNILLTKLGYKPIPFMQEARWFRFLYVSSGIWQSFGWNAIIYFAALASIPTELYEAAIVDGANRFQRIYYITLPGIMPTAVIVLILALGGLLNVGFEKVILMYCPAIYDVADVISSYVYRRSLEEGQYSFGAAVGLFNNVINFVLVFIANKISKKITDIGLW